MRIYLFIFIFLSLNTIAQNIQISGLVKDKKGHVLPGANIFIKGSYDGVSSDSCGKFVLSTALKGEQILCVRFLGYQSFEQIINIYNVDIKVNVVLKEQANDLSAVVIRAGVFEASDEKKAVLLKPLDIVTTASAVGDIYGALQNLPGAQKVGEDGSLFVRGGDKSESRTFIDGFNVDKPYQSQVPDLPSRGRFSPFLFKGTLFCTGGYSAEFGQALSSALILNSVDLAERTLTAVNLMSIGPGLAHTHRWRETSLSVEGNYYNLKPYFNLVKNHYQWVDEPEIISGQIIFRSKTSKTGMFKAFASANKSHRSLFYPDFFSDSKMFHMQDNMNYYGNFSYKEAIGKKTIFKTGFAITKDEDATDNTYYKNLKNYISLHTKAVAIYTINNKLLIKSGLEHVATKYAEKFLLKYTAQNFNYNNMQHLLAGFAEAEVSVSKSLALVNGMRIEYTPGEQKLIFDPRVSIAVKTSKNSQITGAYGIFHQLPDVEYLKINENLQFQKAEHYIIGYQQQIKGRIARIETYYKKYNRLIAFDDVSNEYGNNGFGYAKGIDVFFKDEKTIPYFDYWLAYSYIDSKRKYLNFPELAQPSYISNHNFSVVTKYFVRKITTSFGLTYCYASPRKYNNPNNAQFMSESMPEYHDLSMNFNYITQVFGCYAVVHGSVSNVLGFERNFGYRYSTYPDNNGYYRGYPINADTKRFFLLAIFINF